MKKRVLKMDSAIFRKKWIIRGGVTTLLLSVFLGFYLYNSKITRTSAHPTETILLDTGSSKEFVIPKDATELVENRLIDDSAFKDYVQSNHYVLNSTKINVKGFSTIQPFQNINLSIKTAKNRVLAIGTVGTWGTGVSYNFATTFLFLLDENNTLLDSKQINGSTINETSGGFQTEATDLTALDDGTFDVLTANTSTATGRVLNVKLDSSETSIESITTKNLSFNGSAPNDMSSVKGAYNSIEYGLDTNIYYSGHWYDTTENSYFLQNGRTVAILNSSSRKEINRVRFKYKRVSEVVPKGVWMRIYRLSQTNPSPKGEVYTGAFQYYSNSFGYYHELATWDAEGNIIQKFSPPVEANDMKPLNKISTLNKRYFEIKRSTKTQLVCYDAIQGEFIVVKEYPKGTDFTVITLTNGSYSMVGYLQEVSGEFEMYEGTIEPNSTFVANLDSDFTILSATGVSTGFTSDLTIQSAVDLDDEKYYFSGGLSENTPSNILVGNGNFIDSVQSTLGTSDQFVSKSPNANTYSQNIYGVLKLTEDYAPAMKSSATMLLDLSDPDLDKISGKNNSEWTVLDNWLITGTKDGETSDEKSIKVFDTFDFEESLSLKNEKWLYKRMNKNPMSLDSNIDWNLAGFDKTKVGQQVVSYFVTDSQLQATTVSRKVNKVDDKTAYDTNYAIRAENFDIEVTNLDSLTGPLAKASASTFAWDLVTGEVIEESTSEKNAVIVNETELQKIQESKIQYETVRKEATASGKDPDFEVNYSEILKPYPLTFSYEYKDGNGISQTLTRRITVFVTGETTKVDKSNNSILYADNFRYPLKKAVSLTDKEVLALSHSAAYAYDHSWDMVQTEATLLPVDGYETNLDADYQESPNEKFTGLNHAKTTMDYVMKYTYTQGDDATSNDLSQARLYDETVILHIRQIVEIGADTIVTPTKGYYILRNIDNSVNKKAKAVINTVSDSGEDNATVAYEKILLPTNAGYFYYWINPKELLPQYYEESGYKLSETNIMPLEKQTGDIVLDYSDKHDEYWLTLFIRPTSSNPNFYSWDYNFPENYKIEN